MRLCNGPGAGRLAMIKSPAFARAVPRAVLRLAFFSGKFEDDDSVRQRNTADQPRRGNAPLLPRLRHERDRGPCASRRPRRIETGATVMVPLFVEDGELIRVNTKDGSYVERVKEAKD